MDTYLHPALEWVQANLYWIILAVAVHLATLGTVAYLILLERKVASWVQDRLGPNRVGPFGLLQPIADGIKFFFKEDYRPAKVDKILYTLAPALMITVVIVSIAVIPWGGIKGTRSVADVTNALALGESPARAVDGLLARSYRVVGDVEFFVLPAGEAGSIPVNTPLADLPPAARDAAVVYSADGVPRPGPHQRDLAAVPPNYANQIVLARYTSGFNFQIANLNIGVLFVLSILSLAVYGIVLGGWASNNKYSFLGGIRACANMISYEIPLGLSVLVIVVMFGTLDLNQIVGHQAGYWLGFIPAWNVFTQPLAFILFLICIHAEANRAPFDMAEAEQELVGGYHTEYSSMRFALFFLAEYLGMITTSLVCVALFFGGWHLPWVEWLWTGTRPDVADPTVTSSWIVLILRGVVFFGKAILVLFTFMWVRWSLPRFRFDQIMQMAWRGLIPMSLALLIGTILAVYFTGGGSFVRVTTPAALLFLGVNVVVLAASMAVYQFTPRGATVNHRIAIPDSRFADTPLPGKPLRQPKPAVLPPDPGVQLGGAAGGFAA